MASPFKKKIVRYVTPEGKRCSPDTPGAIKRVEKSHNYYGLVPQPHGKRKAIPLCPDHSRSKQLLNKLLTDATMRRHGIGDPYAEHKRKPLADHLADFRAALSAKGNTEDYIALVSGRLDALAGGCGWQTLDDLSASQAEEWLARQRSSGRNNQNLPGARRVHARRGGSTSLCEPGRRPGRSKTARIASVRPGQGPSLPADYSGGAA